MFMFFRSRKFTLGLLTLVVVLLFADQNLLAPNLSAVAEEFGFDGAFRPKSFSLACFVLVIPTALPWWVAFPMRECWNGLSILLSHRNCVI